MISSISLSDNLSREGRRFVDNPSWFPAPKTGNTNGRHFPREDSGGIDKNPVESQIESNDGKAFNERNLTGVHDHLQVLSSN
ncbi:hypothetical protein L6452_43193 [Arctium lappa]|uniref:Uncharacterized protein n=1 Tax=Arctium lappa TaxID=4217 RepID=A0ACB8XPF4_ARCLA|nr:hypothetical protein L6452_43193 [Arctium lappa]